MGLCLYLKVPCFEWEIVSVIINIISLATKFHLTEPLYVNFSLNRNTNPKLHQQHRELSCCTQLQRLGLFLRGITHKKFQLSHSIRKS